MAVSLHINMVSRGTSPHHAADSCPDSVLLYSRLSAVLFLCLIGAIRNPFWVNSLMKRVLARRSHAHRLGKGLRHSTLGHKPKHSHLRQTQGITFSRPTESERELALMLGSQQKLVRRRSWHLNGSRRRSRDPEKGMNNEVPQSNLIVCHWVSDLSWSGKGTISKKSKMAFAAKAGANQHLGCCPPLGRWLRQLCVPYGLPESLKHPSAKVRRKRGRCLTFHLLSTRVRLAPWGLGLCKMRRFNSAR